jgi:hypothetical protein
MSSTENINQLSDVVLTEIIAPSVGDVGYAESLREAFTNINNNFGTLANHDFVKGDSGSSVEIRPVKFFTEEGNITVYGQRLKDCIESLAVTADELAPVTINETTYNVFSNFEENPGQLYMVFKKDSINDELGVAVSSLYYIFLDGRYANKNLSYADENQYKSRKDFSCVVVYDEELGEFKALTNAFPTIYYEDGVGLCWWVNGTGTGIPVAGMPGKNGSNANLVLVSGNPESIPENPQLGDPINIIITGIYESYFGYKSIEDCEDVEIDELDGQSALILATSTSDTSENLFYFGKLFKDDNGVLKGNCNLSTSINSAIKSQNIINAMKNIDILNTNIDASNGLQGLFIPLEKETDGKQKAHILTAASITNTDGLRDLKTDVMLAPVQDINNLKLTNEEKFEVDKYLYVKINQKHEIFSANTSYANPYLKYRLERVVLHKESEYLGVYNTQSNNSGSRYYGNVHYNGNNVSINSDVTTVIGRNGQPSLNCNHLDSMPTEYFECLADNQISITDTTRGIYRWELCNDWHKFDADELKDSHEDNTSYDFDKSFKVIYTTTITPSASTKFLWFNGMMLAEGWKDSQFATDNGANTKYVVPGWTTSDEFPIFEFVKFVPVYDNDFKVHADTSLNLNYNVNITGDEENPYKSITVHGDVNCDNLSVYRLTATGEIKNIYTKDDIIGESGIKLGKVEDNDYDDTNDVYKFAVDANGVVTADSIKIVGEYVGNSINVTDTNITNLHADNLNVDVNDETNTTVASIHAGRSSACDDGVGVTMKNVHEIDIIAHDHEKDTIDSISKVPAIRTNVPGHFNGNSNVVISNQANDSANVYLKGTLKSIDDYNPGTGVGADITNINETSFESAKNFNMHRLSLQASGGSNSSVKKLGSFTSLGTNGSSSDVSYKWTISTNSPSMNETAEINTSTTSINYNYVTENYLQKVTIVKNGNEYLSSNDDIILNMTDYFFTNIGIYTGCENGRWGLLHSDSNLVLKIYYVINNTLYDAGAAIQSFKFDHSTNSAKNDSGYEWVGISEKGADFGSKDYANKWRYRTYIFKPNNMQITRSNPGFNNIRNAFNQGSPIEIFIVPIFRVKAHSQNNIWGNPKDLAGGVRASCPRPVSISSTTNDMKTKLISGNGFTTGKYKYAVYKSAKTNTAKIEYTVSVTSSSSSDVKTTTICNDGIVMRAGGYVFGLGYAENIVDHNKNDYDEVATGSNPHWSMKNPNNYKQNIPVLFYHKHNNNYYYSNHLPKNDSTDSKGYAQRMNAIPLEDIFNAIKILRNDDFSKYGL